MLCSIFSLDDYLFYFCPISQNLVDLNMSAGVSAFESVKISVYWFISAGLLNCWQLRCELCIHSRICPAASPSAAPSQSKPTGTTCLCGHLQKRWCCDSHPRRFFGNEINSRILRLSLSLQLGMETLSGLFTTRPRSPNIASSSSLGKDDLAAQMTCEVRGQHRAPPHA